MLTDKGFHDIGVPQVGDHVPTRRGLLAGQRQLRLRDGGREGAPACRRARGRACWKLTLASNKLAPRRRPGAINFDDRPNRLRATSRSSATGYCAPIDQSLKGAWRTPSLRDVAMTAPYMHDGYYRTLEDVVWHYNTGGTASGTDDFRDCRRTTTGESTADAGRVRAPDPASRRRSGAPRRSSRSALTDEEIADLVEFLKTLTGEPLPTADWSSRLRQPGAAPGQRDARRGRRRRRGAPIDDAYRRLRAHAVAARR